MFRISKDGFLVYDPFIGEGKRVVEKKHDCADCSFCQMCAESRCNLCRNRRKQATSRIRKLSLREQAEFYERLNHCC
jgi:hypothetical protein